MTRKTSIVIFTAVVALAVFVALAFLYKNHQGKEATERAASQFDSMVREHSPVIGPVTAPVTIVEFLDPACEACRAFYPYVKQILAAYPEQVRLVVRYAPFHGEISVVSAQIFEAAREQGKFQPVMTAMFESQPIWASHSSPSPEKAWEAAAAAGLNVEQAKAYAASGVVEKLLEQEVADVQAVGVQSTPTFFVDGKPLLKHDPRVLHEMVKGEVERAGTKL